MSDPVVSMIVPVYNSEKYLRRCLDSLVFQSLDNIEIIAVNNGSEDNSLSILNEYQAAFPNKFLVIDVPHCPYAGRGRNIGMHHARANYIAFCDSDDMMHLRGLELLYEKAVSENCDLVFCPHYRIEGEHQSIGGRFSGKYNPTVNDLILSASPSVWGKLIHKDLIKKIGDMPENMSAEDVAYSFLLHTFATKIGYIDNSIYFYINRPDSEVRSFLSPKKMDNVVAQDYGYCHCNPKYKNEVMAKIGCLTDVFIHRDWAYGDFFIERAKKIWPMLENNKFFFEHYRFNYERLKKYIDLPDEPMPCQIFISDFEHLWKKEEVLNLSNKIFRNPCKIIKLDESNCDVQENPVINDAYKKKDFDFVGKYFAIKNIFLYGGIYISHDIQIDAPMNYLRYFNSFWGYEDEQNFSDKVFGGIKEGKIFERILSTYSFYSYQDFPTLSSRVRNILVTYYNVSLREARSSFFFHSDFALLSPDLLVCNPTDGLSALFPQMHFCSYDYSTKCFDIDDPNIKKEYVILKHSTLKALLKNSVKNMSSNSNIRALREQISILENSDSWKITAPLRRFSQTRIGKQFLKLYRFLLKIRKA